MRKTRTTRGTVVMLLSNPYNPDDRVRNEADALLELGCPVVILAWDRDGRYPADERRAGLQIRRMVLPVGYGQGLTKVMGYLRVWRWYVDELWSRRPDVVHCHDYDTYLAGLWYSLFHRDTKLVLDAHENYHMMMKPLVSAPVARIIDLLERALTGAAQLLICSNEATAQHYGRYGARKVVVVGNWKDPQSYRFADDVLARKCHELNVPGGHLVIAYIGALTEDRNVVPLLEAVLSRPWVFLILGGGGAQEETLRAMCSKARNAIFLGYVPPDDVPLITAIADVIFYGMDPLHVYAPYNAPNKLYEALAAGKAVIAGDLGGELSDVVKKTQCGLLLPAVTTSAIGVAIDSLANRSLRVSMQERARHAGQTTYNLSVCQRVLKEAYASLLGF